jgi:hypothetical protein
LVVFALAAAVLLWRAERVGYNTDEGQHVATAGYFRLVFLEGTLGGPAWDETYWTLTQPSLPRYILGAAIWLSGNPLPPLDLEHRIREVRGPDRERYLDPRTYADERRLAQERQVERPRPAVLTAARVPMALLGAGSVALLFLIGRALGGTVAGLVAALGLLAAPLALTLLPRAHAEAPLLFFTLLGLLLGIHAARAATATGPVDEPRGSQERPDPSCHPERSEGSHARGQGNMRSFAALRMTGKGQGIEQVPAWLLFGLLCGMATGLAAASKLTAVLGLAALGAFAAWAPVTRLALGGATGRGQVAAGGRAAGRTWRWSALAAVVGLATFVAVNPFLWPDPVGRTVAMLRFRQQELFGQRALSPENAVPEDLPTRTALLLRRTFMDEAPLAARTGLPLDAPLALVGTWVLARGASRTWRAGGLLGPEAFALAWIAAFVAGTIPNLGINWDRYYLPVVALSLVPIGVGAATLLDAGLRAARPPGRGEDGPTSAKAPA